MNTAKDLLNPNHSGILTLIQLATIRVKVCLIVPHGVHVNVGHKYLLYIGVCEGHSTNDTEILTYVTSLKLVSLQIVNIM